MTAGPEAIDRTLAALADPVRRRTIELLAQRPRRSGELAEEVGVTAAAMSKHLRVLRDDELVEPRPDGVDARVRVYALRSAAMVDLRDWIRRTEQGWVGQLDALRRHVEGEP